MVPHHPSKRNRFVTTSKIAIHIKFNTTKHMRFPKNHHRIRLLNRVLTPPNKPPIFLKQPNNKRKSIRKLEIHIKNTITPPFPNMPQRNNIPRSTKIRYGRILQITPQPII
ncbi:hypothetical protein ACOSQ3_031397 [Xanthoceras sorbifolium]